MLLFDSKFLRSKDSTVYSDKERKLLRNKFVGKIQSKYLRILGSLEYLNCCNDTKKLQNTKYQRRKLEALYSAKSLKQFKDFKFE